MDSYARQKLREAEATLEQGGQLPAGRQCWAENPAKYRKNKTFVKCTPHMKWKRWQKMQPRCDGLALDIVMNHVDYELDRPMEVPTKEPMNGQLAREHWEQLSGLLMKDMRRGCYEVCGKEGLDVVLPFNLAPKPDGVPHPWRVCQRAIVVNGALADIRVRVEGTKSIGMIVTPRSWMIAIDLQSGYQQILCTQRVRRLQGG